MESMAPGSVRGLRCLNCGEGIPFTFPAYRCGCGGNLEVEYDLPGLRAAWQSPGVVELASAGQFAFQPLLPLATPGRAHFPAPIGGSPLVEMPAIARELGLASLALKDDTRLLSASFKDRASSVLVAMAAERGIDRMCTASTGNAGCSMACLCAGAGIKAYVFVPATAPRAKISQLLFYGATVVQVRGNYDAAFELCWGVSLRLGWLNRSTGWNPFTREGKKTVSFEICLQSGWEAPDRVFVPVGDGNIISGVWKGFKELHALGVIRRLPRLMAVSSAGSAAVAEAVARVRAGARPEASIVPVKATTVADSISVDDPRDGVAAVRAVVESEGEAVVVSDDEIRAAIVTLARRASLFAEPAGAAAYAGLLRWCAGRAAARRERVAVLVTGNGLKDVDAAAAILPPPLQVGTDLSAALELVAGHSR